MIASKSFKHRKRIESVTRGMYRHFPRYQIVKIVPHHFTSRSSRHLLPSVRSDSIFYFVRKTVIFKTVFNHKLNFKSSFSSYSINWLLLDSDRNIFIKNRFFQKTYCRYFDTSNWDFRKYELKLSWVIVSPFKRSWLCEVKFTGGKMNWRQLL